jgi:hypothetical protein
VQVLAERHGGATGGSDAFSWELQRLQQYSKTQPIAAIIARSPGKAVLVRFDEQGSALLFDPCYDLDGSRRPTFFAFPNQGEGLQQHLAETFPFHDEYATTQHWHHAHFNEYVYTTLWKQAPQRYKVVTVYGHGTEMERDSTDGYGNINKVITVAKMDG